MPSQSSIRIEIHSPTSCIVTLHGEHDLASREPVTMALALARSYASVLVDLTTCTFIDGTVTSALLEAAARLRRADRSLELIVPAHAHEIRRALDLTGVLPIIPLHESRPAGLAALASEEVLGAHRRRLELRAVTAEIDRLSSLTEAGRALRATKAGAGTTIIRARVAEIDETAAQPRRRAA